MCAFSSHIATIELFDSLDLACAALELCFLSTMCVMYSFNLRHNLGLRDVNHFATIELFDSVR
jgi:hypothetical protein